MKRVLARKPRADGAFCYNDLVAAGALRACLEAGLAVPREIAIIGCGNHCLTDLLLVPLSTVDQQTTRIGQAAARTLLRQMNGDAPARTCRIFVPPTLIVRESTRR